MHRIDRPRGEGGRGEFVTVLLLLPVAGRKGGVGPPLKLGGIRVAAGAAKGSGALEESDPAGCTLLRPSRTDYGGSWGAASGIDSPRVGLPA